MSPYTLIHDAILNKVSNDQLKKTTKKQNNNTKFKGWLTCLTGQNVVSLGKSTVQ